jgi:hypothetical protein
MTMTSQFANPEAVDAFIRFLITQANSKPISTSRTKLPCTYCSIQESTTWRPGPCGPSTLCNKCGVMYMDTGKRHRQIDLIMSKNCAMWVKKDQSCWLWKEDKQAPVSDPRVLSWIQRESIRVKLTKDLNPAPLKRVRV